MPYDQLPERAPVTATYRRFLLDMHVPDHDPRLLSRFDVDHFLDAVADAGVATVTLPSNGHHGLAFWPASVGAVHQGPGASDFLPRMLAGAAERGLNRVVYHCLLYVEQYWAEHPEARIADARGGTGKVAMPRPPHPRRFAILCPNDGRYRAFATAQLTELCRRYEFEAVNLDMMFWASVCFCTHCVARCRSELGADIPRTVDWTDPGWVAFAAARRRWLLEFVAEITEVVRRERPDVIVIHQSQMYTQDWVYGGSDDLAEYTEWLSSDLYRSTRELSFDFKLFHGLSRRHPFEEISCWSSPDIHEHVLDRTPHGLQLLAGLAAANDAAIVFIDQPDPDGGINDRQYEVIRPINARLQGIEPWLGGRPLYDVLIYVSFSAGFDADDAPIPIEEIGNVIERDHWRPGPYAHRPASRAAASCLAGAHIPFGVVTRRGIAALDPDRVLVISNAALLADDEVQLIIDFVERGGTLYASGDTSMLGRDGPRDDFALSRVLGVTSRRVDRSGTAYLARVGSEPPTGPRMPSRPLTVSSSVRVVEPHPGTHVLGELVPSWTDPAGEAYVSTLTNPPGPTADGAILTRSGRSVYSGAVLEAATHPAVQEVFLSAVRDLLGREPTISLEGHRCLEITAFDRDGRWVVHIVNTLSEGPLPVSGAVLVISRRDVVGCVVVGSGMPLDPVLDEDGTATRIVLPAVAVHEAVEVRFA